MPRCSDSLDCPLTEAFAYSGSPDGLRTGSCAANILANARRMCNLRHTVCPSTPDDPGAVSAVCAFLLRELKPHSVVAYHNEASLPFPAGLATIPLKPGLWYRGMRGVFQQPFQPHDGCAAVRPQRGTPAGMQ
jgi:hypothetical protein